MGTVVSKALLEKQTNAIVVANRTYDKAQQLAKELDGIAIRFSSMDENLHKIDILISATGAPHTLINKKRIEVLPKEHLENMVMLDLANPRDIDDDVRELKISAKPTSQSGTSEYYLMPLNGLHKVTVNGVDKSEYIRNGAIAVHTRVMDEGQIVMDSKTGSCALRFHLPLQILDIDIFLRG